MALAAVAAAEGGPERLLFSGPRALRQLEAVLAGSGVVGIRGREVEGRDGRLVWRVWRDETDELGMRHVFYRQYLEPAGELAQRLPEPWRSQGIRILSGELGLHYRGSFLVIAHGTQTGGGALAVLPAICTPAQARARAEVELAQWSGFSAHQRATLPPEDEKEHGTAIALVLAPGAGYGLELQWHLLVLDRRGMPFFVTLDAASGSLLAVDPAFAGGACGPDLDAAVPATAIPEIPWLPTRTLAASPATSRPFWQYEAYWWRWSQIIPPIELYQGLLGDAACAPGARNYVLTPLKVWGPMGPRYVDYEDPDAQPSYVAGYAAGDAMYHTAETMESLVALGWNPRWRFGHQLRCTVDLDFCRDNAFYFFVSTPWAPAGVATCKKAARPYRMSASLDVVAHEWGHGVVQATAGWTYSLNDPHGGGLHEGFADVIAHATEWMRPQPFLPPDWTLGEDSGQPFRDLTQVDGTHSFHAGHQPPNCQAHCHGHRLAVAFRLLGVGGRNPLCPENSCPSYPGSDTVVPPLGVGNASRIFLRALTYYATATTQWSDLPGLAKAAAFDLFSHCPTYPPGYAAEAEQEAVARAFAAIGYPSEGYFSCHFPDYLGGEAQP